MSTAKRVGILGGGQLARMLAESVENGNTFLSYDKEGSCAFDVCEAFTKDLNDKENLDQFCSQVDVVTFDSEFLGTEFADDISARGLNVYPSKSFVEMSGDRLLEKSEINRLGIPTANFVAIEKHSSSDQIFELLSSLLQSNELSDIGLMLKTRHGGYDGKGQWLIKKDSENELLKNISDEVQSLTVDPGLIIEGLVDFDFECSIIASRSINGEMKTWPLVHNIHKDSILELSRSPIPREMISEEEENKAKEIVEKLCGEHDYVGTICVELFHTKMGLVVNEIAPRVHNSGHLTIEGSSTSQFKNHINAITGVELGDTDIKGHIGMINIVGFALNDEAISIIESTDGVFLHWYNKEVRPKRKVGHITIVCDSSEERENLISKIQGTFK